MKRVRAMLALCVCAFGFLGPGSASAQGKVAVKPKPSAAAAPVSAAPVPSPRSQAFATSRQNMSAGHAASAAGDHAKALKHYQLAWAAVKYHAQGTGRNAAVVLDSIGKAYVDLRQDGQAGLYLREALVEFRRETPNDHDRLATTLDRLASLEARMNNYGQSLQWRREEIIQRRILADRIQADPSASPRVREQTWLALVATVSQLSDNGHTMEGFDQFEAAIAALDKIPNTLETRIIVMQNAGSTVSMFDTSKAQQYYNDGLRLVEDMPESDQKRLYLASFTELLAGKSDDLGRFEQATAQLQTALNYAQSALPSPRRDALVSSISKTLSTNALKRQKYSDAIRWSQVAFGAAQTDDARADALISAARAELALKNIPEAKRNVDQALALLTPSFDREIPHLIIKRMFLSQIYTDLGEKDRALALYDGAFDAAKAIQSPIFSQFDILYLAAGTKTLQNANQAPRAYANLATAGRSLIEGPGRTFGVNLDSRRIFNEFRFVFQNQMRAGWIAAHADGAPPSQGATNETR